MRKQQEKLDKEVARLRDETPQQKQRRLANEEKERQKDREFLLEIPDLYNLGWNGKTRLKAVRLGDFRDTETGL